VLGDVFWCVFFVEQLYGSELLLLRRSYVDRVLRVDKEFMEGIVVCKAFVRCVFSFKKKTLLFADVPTFVRLRVVL